MTDKRIEMLKSAIQPNVEKLKNHKLYFSIDNIAAVRIFMENHVFAVWDFMTLLKRLQIDLTSVSLPWLPSGDRKSRRLINEIVLAEESDLVDANPISHFEYYLEAMAEAGARVDHIESFIFEASSGVPIIDALERHAGPIALKFVKNTFEQMNGELYEVASAFAFGREDIIPEVFLSLMSNNSIASYPKLKTYLERHIELDGDEHGPAAVRLIQTLCEDDGFRWQAASDAANKALASRIVFWDEIYDIIRIKNYVAA